LIVRKEENHFKKAGLMTPQLSLISPYIL